MDPTYELSILLAQPTGTSSAGYPYLSRVAWARLRDWLPHTFVDGQEILARLDQHTLPEQADAARVVKQVVRTAAVTAPPDLWLVRQVVGHLAAEGWLDRLARGLSSVPEALEPDLTLLLGRGYLVRSGQGVRWSDDPTAQRVLHETGPLPSLPADLSRVWAEACGGVRAHDDLLASLLDPIPPRAAHPPPAWVATPEDLDVAFRLVPLVLGLEASGTIDDALKGRLPLPDALARRAAALLRRAGWWGDEGPTELGRRGLRRGPGPFGIIETYHPYLANLPRIWAEGAAAVHVERAGNVAASQAANRKTFRQANDALDRFCADTGFDYRVFLEHAVGRGEATRQRYARDGDRRIYVGADLEAAALDAARAEQAAGHLPASMRFVQADIGEPSALVAALRDEGIDPRGAVMLVGNGFHEVRGQTDERMVEVFRGYADAGFLLLFTEESALSVDDLLRTAFNTYHAGFRYVHERSGQGLRPASPTPASALGPPLRASWEECATRAGYRRADAYCVSSRTIYPYTPASGHNPSVSVSHFFLPPEP
jgi:hypothetical protein